MPASPYAIAKVAAHNLVRNYRKSYGLHASCGILFNHEGPLRGETFVTQKIIKAVHAIKSGKQDKLELGNIYAYRDWGYANEYTEAMRLMLDRDVPDDYVIATGETHTVEEFLHEAFRLAGLDASRHLVINDIYKRPHEVPYLKGDCRKAKEKLLWEPQTKFKELVKIMFDAGRWKKIITRMR
jgi:GDPmannose 4,6-dehydratase